MRKLSIAAWAALAAAPWVQAESIYRCTLADGSVAIQQQPCASAVEQKVYSFPNTTRSDNTRGPAALPGPRRIERQPSRSQQRSRPRTQRESISKRLKQCQKLWNREEDLRETEREGYTASEGEKIRRQLRRIKRDKKLLRCDELK